jgi:hypothetical protein
MSLGISKFLLKRIKGLIKMVSFRSSYLIASACLIGCMISSITNDTTLRYLVGTGMKVTHILLFAQAISITISFILISLFRPGLSYKPKYWKLLLFRSTLATIAFISSKLAITIAPIPLYLSAFAYLSIPAINMVFSTLLLGEKLNLYGLFMGLSIILPLTKYLGIYTYSIALLFISCIIFSFLDCSLAFMSREKKPKSGLLASMVTHRGKEEVLLVNLFEGVVVLLIYLAISAQDFISYGVPGLELSKIPFFFLMACMTFAAMPLLSIAYGLEKVSSIQPVKSLEPVLAGSFADRKNLPGDVGIGIVLFFCASLLMIYKESKENLDKKDL